MASIDLEECRTLRADEWQAFESIYPDSVHVPPEATAGGTRVHLELPVDLGSESNVELVYPEPLSTSQMPLSSSPTKSMAPISLRLTHLPPLLVTLLLPPAYPLRSPPKLVSLHATQSWLPPSAQTQLLANLGEKWDAEAGEGVLWPWAEWIRGGDFLDEIGLRQGNAIRIFHPAPRLLAPLLTQHNDAALDTLFSQRTFACAICLTLQKGSQCLALSGCGHVFCRACLRDFWGLHIAEGDAGKVACADSDCVKGGANEVGEEEVRRVCGDDALERWRWLREKRELEKDPTIVYCPLQVCQAPVPRGPQEQGQGKENRWEALRTCPRCGFSFCAYCRRTWHGVLTRCVFSQAQAFVLAYAKAAEGSAERKAIEQRYGRANVLRLVAQYEEEEQNRKWLKDSTMACPGCSVSVEKSMGCNHMTCARCMIHFCYRCGHRLNPSNPYSHFNDVRNKCALFDASELRENDDQWQPVAAFEALGQIDLEGEDIFAAPNWRRLRD